MADSSQGRKWRTKPTTNPFQIVCSNKEKEISKIDYQSDKDNTSTNSCPANWVPTQFSLQQPSSLPIMQYGQSGKQWNM